VFGVVEEVRAVARVKLRLAISTGAQELLPSRIEGPMEVRHEIQSLGSEYLVGMP
jgi:hypothetical protein